MATTAVKVAITKRRQSAPLGPVKCPVCGKEVASINGLGSHMRLHKSAPEVTANAAKPKKVAAKKTSKKAASKKTAKKSTAKKSTATKKRAEKTFSKRTQNAALSKVLQNLEGRRKSMLEKLKDIEAAISALRHMR